MFENIETIQLVSDKDSVKTFILTEYFEKKSPMPYSTEMAEAEQLRMFSVSLTCNACIMKRLSTN